MKLLEDRIIQDGTIKPGGILKVDNFLNHQIDTGLLYEMACEWKRLYVNCDINKILTIEASGIGLASMTGYVFGCPVLFAKKSKTTNISSDVYSVEVPSFTHKTVNTVMVSREYLHADDRVLIIDDDTIWGFDEAVVIDAGVGGEVVDKTDVLTFWSFDWADTAVMGVMDVADFHGSAVTG